MEGLAKGEELARGAVSVPGLPAPGRPGKRPAFPPHQYKSLGPLRFANSAKESNSRFSFKDQVELARLM